jgi:hypothetical protein
VNLKYLLQAFAAFAFCCSAAHAATVSEFNFDNDNLGTTTTFTDRSGALSATFSSSADPGGFIIFPSIFETLTGNVLGGPGPSNASNIALDIAFNQALSAITLNFATDDFSTPSPLTLAAYDNATPVGSTTLTGEYLSGFQFPEGEIAFDGANFNSVVISTTAPDFAVDNILVTTVGVPEPGTISMIATGLLLTGVGAVRRRNASLRSYQPSTNKF